MAGSYSLTGLENTLDLYLVQKAPALPLGAKNFIVKVLPWLTLIVLIFSLPLVLAFFGLSAFLLPVSFLAGAGEGIQYILAMIFLIVSLALDVVALPGLFKTKKKAWNLIFYSTLLNAVYNLLTFNLGGLIIGTLISLYILFQIRSYYH